MEGISKERLLRLREFTVHPSDAREVFDELIAECTELNPLVPIDEKTPRDKLLLLYSPGVDGEPRKFVGKLQSCWYWKPTHYQELPEDPE